MLYCAMTDTPDPTESSLQRAVRLKKEALAARPKDRPGGKSGLKASAPMAAGKSKPWMGK